MTLTAGMHFPNKTIANDVGSVTEGLGNPEKILSYEHAKLVDIAVRVMLYLRGVYLPGKGGGTT